MFLKNNTFYFWSSELNFDKREVIFKILTLLYIQRNYVHILGLPILTIYLSVNR